MIETVIPQGYELWAARVNADGTPSTLADDVGRVVAWTATEGLSCLSPVTLTDGTPYAYGWVIEDGDAVAYYGTRDEAVQWLSRVIAEQRGEHGAR